MANMGIMVIVVAISLIILLTNKNTSVPRMLLELSAIIAIMVFLSFSEYKVVMDELHNTEKRYNIIALEKNSEDLKDITGVSEVDYNVRKKSAKLIDEYKKKYGNDFNRHLGDTLVIKTNIEGSYTSFLFKDKKGLIKTDVKIEDTSVVENIKGKITLEVVNDRQTYKIGDKNFNASYGVLDKFIDKEVEIEVVYNKEDVGDMIYEFRVLKAKSI